MSLWDKTSKLPEYLNFKDKRRVVATDEGFVLGRTYTDTNGHVRNKKEILVALRGVGANTEFGAPTVTDVWFDVSANTPGVTANVAANTNVNIFVSYDQPIGYANSTVGTLALTVANTTAGATIVATSNTSFFGANNQVQFTIKPTVTGVYTIQAQSMTNATSTSIASLGSLNTGKEAIDLTIANTVLGHVGSINVA